MKTLRSIIEKPIYDHIAYHVALVDKDGEDTVFRGIRELDDPEKFVHGTLVNQTVDLYVYYVKNANPDADKIFSALMKFMRYAISAPMKTWGKLAVLRAVRKLYSAGLLDNIPAEYIDILREKTKYDDFLDKESMTLKGYPSNYLQVAMACAGIREFVGWDSEPFSLKIREKLLSIMENGSELGYMDENPPYSRFDRYSMLVSSEFTDTCELIGQDVPAVVESNLAHASKVCVAMANAKGDGVNYGRSLSCHGDGAAMEIISSAFVRGLIDDDDKGVALAYCGKIAEKIMNFWYDSDMRSFNIWWNGRSTNRYRKDARVLEVNLDMANHLLTSLHNFERAGIADIAIDESMIPSPAEWKATSINFLDSAEAKAKTVILRRGDTLAMLPLVGLGDRYRWSAYLPVPMICGRIEPAPEAGYPFLMPEYTLGDVKYRPLQYYKKICVNESEGVVTVRAEGNLAICGGKYPERSEYSFSINYRFSGNLISAEFETDLSGARAEMLVGLFCDGTTCRTAGFGKAEPLTTAGVYDFCTPHGAITEAVSYVAENAGKLSYELNIKD